MELDENSLQPLQSGNQSELTNSDSHIGDTHISYEAFNTALKELSFVQREAITLQQEGFSLADIELITQSNAQTIKTRLRYAKQNLKQLLGDNNEQV